MMFVGTEASAVGSHRSFSSMSVYSLRVYLYVLAHVYAQDAPNQLQPGVLYRGYALFLA